MPFEKTWPRYTAYDRSFLHERADLFPDATANSEKAQASLMPLWSHAYSVSPCCSSFFSIEANARRRSRLENFSSSRVARYRMDLSVLFSEYQAPLRFDAVMVFLKWLFIRRENALASSVEMQRMRGAEGVSHGILFKQFVANRINDMDLGS